MKIEKRIKRKIIQSKNVFVVAHKNLDLDALGSCIGVSSICKHFHKKCYIIIDDFKHELGVEKVLKEVGERHSIISSKEIPKYHQNKSILIITDTNKEQLLQNNQILSYFDIILILDHHQETDQTIPNTIHIIDEDASSASEIVTKLICFYHVSLDKKDATCLLAGIVLDTNNFVVKTDVETYHAAYFLTKSGADNRKVQYYLKQDINDYIIRQKVITEVQVLHGKYALSIAPKEISYKREELAKIADTLLQFHHIRASFVLGYRVDGGVGFSARSDGSVNVGEIAEALGGGGDMNDAASQIKNMTLEQAEKELRKHLK